MGLPFVKIYLEDCTLIQALQKNLYLYFVCSIAGFTGVFGDNKDGNGRGDAFRFAMEYTDEHGSLPSEIPELMEVVYR